MPSARTLGWPYLIWIFDSLRSLCRIRDKERWLNVVLPGNRVSRRIVSWTQTIRSSMNHDVILNLQVPWWMPNYWRDRISMEKIYKIPFWRGGGGWWSKQRCKEYLRWRPRDLREKNPRRVKDYGEKGDRFCYEGVDDDYMIDVFLFSLKAFNYKIGDKGSSLLLLSLLILNFVSFGFPFLEFLYIEYEAIAVEVECEDESFDFLTRRNSHVVRTTASFLKCWLHQGVIVLYQDYDHVHIKILFSFEDDLHVVTGLERLCVSSCLVVWLYGLKLVCSLQFVIITSWNTEQFWCLWLDFSFMPGTHICIWLAWNPVYPQVVCNLVVFVDLKLQLNDSFSFSDWIFLVFMLIQMPPKSGHLKV